MKRSRRVPSAGGALLTAGLLAAVLLGGCRADEPGQDGSLEAGRTAAATSQAAMTTQPETSVPSGTQPAATATARVTARTTANAAAKPRTDPKPTEGNTMTNAATQNKTQAPATTTRPKPRPTLAGPNGKEAFTNLTFDNGGGKCGDADGPAYMVYSKVGYRKASMDILLSGVEMNVFRESDLLPLTAYIFLGVDVYDEGGAWINCFDAGLGYHTGKQKWTLFHNIYDVPLTQNKWYMSSKYLDETHDYRIVLDTSQNAGWAALTVYDLTEGGREHDSVIFQTKGTKTDGSNTAFLQDYALDFPDNVKYNTSGRPVKNNWQEITLYNTDENVYMRNIQIVNATLDGQPWTAEKTLNRAVWPDCTMGKIDYPVVRVSRAAYDTQLRIDFDMNR